MDTFSEFILEHELNSSFGKIILFRVNHQVFIIIIHDNIYSKYLRCKNMNQIHNYYNLYK